MDWRSYSTGCGSRPPIPYSWLRFAERGGHTALVDAHGQLPLQFQRPITGANGGAIATLLTPAAALFDGDVIDLEVDCAPGTDVTLRTVGATRLNRCDASVISSSLSVRVAAGAVFRYVPHEVIPFRGARYTQRIDVDLAEQATAVLLEVIALGESFSAGRLHFETRLCAQGRTLALERFVLTPESRAALRGRTHYGSLLARGARVSSDPMTDGGASTTSGDCVVLKVLGDSAQRLRQALLVRLDQCHGLPTWA